ncbi:MAG TPA: protein kinase [Solirubrobacterales bacterium]|nr:protein kinase [Solirubrobacterales bacterium]
MAPGTRIGPFRVDRLIATGSTGAVYEATQVSLQRTVALRLIGAEHFKTPVELVRFDHSQRLAASLHHPNLVPYYEAGEWEGGRFVATRLIRGKSLAELRAERRLPTAASLEPLADALTAAHAADLAHGRVSDRNILIESDGTPYLADLGLSTEGSPEADEEALAAEIARLPAKAGQARRTWPVALAVLATVALVAAMVLPVGEDPTDPLQEAPASPPNTTVIGSPLAPIASEPLGCSDVPSANTPACTIAQMSFASEPLRIERAGVVRSWAVRGASGDLALQVIRERDGKSFVAAFSQPERVEDPAPQAFEANIPVRPQDVIGLRLAPGATVGSLPATPDASLERWDGGLTADSAAPDGTTLDGELMLRADVEFGARPGSGGQLLGPEAASAPPGTVLDETHVTLAGGQPARAAVVELPGAIALDVTRGDRLARLEVPDADPEGELLGIEQSCGGAGTSGFCLRWQNLDDELTLFHTYRVRESGRIKLIG